MEFLPGTAAAQGMSQSPAGHQIEDYADALSVQACSEQESSRPCKVPTTSDE